MKERYLKVLALFKYVLRTALGYGIFATGLRYLSRLKAHK